MLAGDVGKKKICARKRVPRNLEIQRAMHAWPARAAFRSNPATPIMICMDKYFSAHTPACSDTLLSEVLLVWTNSEMNLAV